jgi:hypothetical protein
MRAMSGWRKNSAQRVQPVRLLIQPRGKPVYVAVARGVKGLVVDRRRFDVRHGRGNISGTA